jgi:hypothetical protein
MSRGSFPGAKVVPQCRLQSEKHLGKKYITRLDKRMDESIIIPELDKGLAEIDGHTNWPVNMLDSSQLMDKIISCLDNKRPCSVVSVGATEAFAMAQYSIFNENQIRNHPETRVANLGECYGFYHRGISFPHLKVRDELLAAVRAADIVGYNTIIESARELTEKVFAIYKISPPYIFEANLRRVICFSQKARFLQMLAHKKIILIGALAPRAKISMEERWQQHLDFAINDAISIYHYNDIPFVLSRLEKHDFDLALLSAGLNAVIIASFIASNYGKVAFDIGWGMESIISGEVFVDSWIKDIGVASLMNM